MAVGQAIRSLPAGVPVDGLDESGASYERRLPARPEDTRKLLIGGYAMTFCDLKYEYADWPKELSDGSRSCRTFIGLWCRLKEKIVHKNGPCSEKKER
jgi:hypothetical protein